VIEGATDALRVLFAFAVLGFMTWLWGLVYNALMDKYVKPLLNRELNTQTAILGVVA